MKTSQNLKTILAIPLASIVCFAASYLVAKDLLILNNGFGAGDMPVFLYWTLLFSGFLLLPLVLFAILFRNARTIHRVWVGILLGGLAGFGWTLLNLWSLGPWFGAWSFNVLYCWVLGGAFGILALALLGHRPRGLPMSAAGKYPTKDGRQGDRRKIKRAPEDVIRVKIMEPLVSEEDFNLVQKILGMKKSFHWRTSPGFEQRFTYNGYLDCICQGRVYTKYRRRDYYICKEKCGVHYMRRDRLDPYLDQRFAKQLSNERFLRRIARAKKPPQLNVEQVRKQINALTTKRERVLDTYFDGVITEAERDRKVAEIEREKQVFSDLLCREEPARIDGDTLARQFKVFRQFDLLSRDQKRRLLNAITPRIIVANYQVEGMFVGLPESLLDKDSSHPPSINSGGKVGEIDCSHDADEERLASAYHRLKSCATFP